MIHVILAESALELVPNSISSHPAVRSHSKKLNREASCILLDNSWHYSAMKKLGNTHKRGRPDLVHFAILSATSTPLFRAGLMRMYVHTTRDVVIKIANKTKIPKSYHRFEGLFSKLLCRGSVEFEGHVLLEAGKCTMRDLVKSIGPTKTLGFSVRGRPLLNNEAMDTSGDSPCIVIGGFQKGGFAESTVDVLDCMYSISSMSLESHVAMSRILYNMEQFVKL